MSAITYTRRPPARRSHVEQVIIAALLGIGLFLAALLLLFAGWRWLNSGRIYPRVSVGGVSVGGLTPQAAADRLATSLTYPTNGRILLQGQENRWLVSPAELGLLLDPQTSAQNAYRIGRTGGFFASLAGQMRASSTGVPAAPALVFDQRAAYQYLTQIAQEIDQPVIEASVDLQGTEVTVRSGQVGRTLDIPATLALLSTQVQSLQDGIVPLVIQETPPLVLDASAQADLARAMLSQPLTLTLPPDSAAAQPVTQPITQPAPEPVTAAGPWVLDPPTLAGMLTFERVQENGAGRYQVALNNQMLRTYLTNLAPTVDRFPESARFIFNDDTRQLEIIQPAVIGRTLDVEASLHAVQQKLAAGEHTIPLEFTYQQPAITNAVTGEQIGVRELVHMETSYFYGSSAARVQNIKAAASRFHGLLVAPNETFSMSDALGSISLDNGYAEASIIYGDQTIKGVGGGVCQVSTTLFRTAFFTGFPIIERHAHAYRVYYYEKVAGNRVDPRLAGLDATVFVPLVDFRFTNDTPYWLLMETYVNPQNSSITWKFYSTKDGRSVDWDTTGPVNTVPAPAPLYRENPDLQKDEIKQVDWAAEGADVTVNRTVTKDGAVYLQDTFFTQYQPWRDIYEYGPGTDVPTPEPSPEPTPIQ